MGTVVENGDAQCGIIHGPYLLLSRAKLPGSNGCLRILQNLSSMIQFGAFLFHIRRLGKPFCATIEALRGGQV